MCPLSYTEPSYVFAVENRVLRTEQIIMGTAGTVLDWILKRKVVDPSKIVMFVLDEADVMIDQQGQQDQTIRIQKCVQF